MTIKTIAALGDSFMENGTDFGTNSHRDVSIPAWTVFASEGRYIAPPAQNFGVSSERIDQIVARVPNVIAATPTPAYCIINAGPNDLLQNTAQTGPQMAASIKTTLCDPLTAASITPIVLTVAPSPSYTSAQEIRRVALNAALRSAGCNVADFAAAVEAFGAAAYYDALHPDPLGASIAGQTANAAIRSRETGDHIMPTLTVSIPVTGTGGGNSGAPAAGAPPTGWTLYANGASEIYANGGAIRGIVTAGQSPSLGSGLNSTAALSLVAGSQVFVNVACEWKHRDLARIRFKLDFYSAAVGLLGTTYSMMTSSATRGFPQVGSGVVPIGPFVAPTGTATCAVTVEFVAQAAVEGILHGFRLKQCDLYKYV